MIKLKERFPASDSRSNGIAIRELLPPLGSTFKVFDKNMLSRLSREVMRLVEICECRAYHLWYVVLRVARLFRG